MATHAQALAEHILQEPFGDYCSRLRADGTSWRGIAKRLLADTDGVVDVTEQTLRNWVAAQEAAA